MWLVSLVSFTSKSHALMARLAAVQEAFGYLLGDASELIQEMASKGISAVYRLGSDGDRKQLLSALMSTLQGDLPSFKFDISTADAGWYHRVHKCSR